MWTYLVNSLAWSVLGLIGGGALAQVGWDVRTLLRNSGRRKGDHT